MLKRLVDSAADEQPPRAVAQELGEVRAYRNLRLGVDPLAGHLEAEEEEQRAGNGNHYHGPLPSSGNRHAQRVLEEVAEWFPGRQGYERAAVGEEHPV